MPQSPSAARRPFRHLPRRPVSGRAWASPPSAAGGRRLPGRGAGDPDLLRPARLQRRRPRHRRGAGTRRVIAVLEHYDYVVVPSGSCAGMISRHFPALFAGDPQWQRRAEALAVRTHELMPFLVDVRGIEHGRRRGSTAGHLPRQLLRPARAGGEGAAARSCSPASPGPRLKEMADAEVCCGFGGTFCVKYPEISTRMVDDKAARPRRHRRRPAARRRPGLPDEHGRAAEAHGRAHGGAPRGRGSGRPDQPGAGDW